MRRIDTIAIHCSATRPGSDIGANEIRRWHMDRGFKDIGYHFVIRRNGTTEIGRDIKLPGAHVKGYNRHSIGICLVGGISGDTGAAENNFSFEQFEMLRRLIADLQTQYSVPNDNIKGHRDFPNVAKDCPCFDVQKWLHIHPDDRSMP